MSKSLSRKLSIGKAISKGMVKSMMHKPKGGMVAVNAKIKQSFKKKSK